MEKICARLIRIAKASMGLIEIFIFNSLILMFTTKPTSKLWNTGKLQEALLVELKKKGRKRNGKIKLDYGATDREFSGIRNFKRSFKLQSVLLNLNKVTYIETYLPQKRNSERQKKNFCRIFSC